MATVDMGGLTSDTLSAWTTLVAAAASQLGFVLEPRSARRTCAEQAEQWAIGRSGPNDTRAETTHAQGCTSWHVTGRAVDFNIRLPNGSLSTSPADYASVGQLAESEGWKWGGRFSGFGPNGDQGHVEYHPGLTIAQVCPDPTHCVDTPELPVESSILGSFGWKSLLGLGVAVSVAVGVGVGLGRRS